MGGKALQTNAGNNENAGTQMQALTRAEQMQLCIAYNDRKARENPKLIQPIKTEKIHVPN